MNRKRRSEGTTLELLKLFATGGTEIQRFIGKNSSFPFAAKRQREDTTGKILIGSGK
jgi:hypothetical protein